VTLLLREGDLEGLLDWELAVESLKEAMKLEADGLADLPPRLNTGSPRSWLRLMPAALNALDGRATMGFKAMNKADGVRYMVMLYEPESGELLSIIEAAHLTRVRTAAMTALACRSTRPGELTEIGLFGSGYEASSHVEALKALYPGLRRVAVFSPNRERREAFAERTAEALGIEVTPVEEPARAAKAPVVVLATKTKTPVVEAGWFEPGTLVLSIGSTRLDLRELDEELFARTEWCVCDAPEQVATESGDVAAALGGGYLRRERLMPMCEIVAGRGSVPWPPKDLLVFKSVGTALQDLAVGRAVYQRCREEGRGTDLGVFPVSH
jgi:ornithine cyclodeaminase/alanine dehydrogenase